MKKYIGLDIGNSTIGVAYSENGIFASNLITFRSNNNIKILLKNLVIFLKENNYDIVVIGDPKHMNNDAGDRSKLSITIKNNLEKIFPNTKFILWDERLTTKQTYDIIHQIGKSEKYRKEKKDELAAEIILQSYLDYINKNE